MVKCHTKIGLCFLFLSSCAILFWNEEIASLVLDTSLVDAKKIQTDPDVSRSVAFAIQPVWTSPPSRTNYFKSLFVPSVTGQKNIPEKLLFVHVFKTAGSTMRRFFSQYSRLAGHHCGIVAHCTDVPPEDLYTNYTGPWSRCTMQKNYKEYTTNSSSLASDYDVLAGHFRIGTMDQLQTSPQFDNRPFKLRHVTFVRNAATLFASGHSYIYAQRVSSLEELVETLKDRVRADLKEGNYRQIYGNYYLTPQQQRDCDRRGPAECSYQKRNDLMKENLLKYNLTICVVERMKESMELLQRIMDPGTIMTEFFEEFERDGGGGQIANPSLYSSSKILALLKNDTEFYPQFLDYVKYDQEISDFGMKLHLLQYGQAFGDKRALS